MLIERFDANRNTERITRIEGPKRTRVSCPNRDQHQGKTGIDRSGNNKEKSSEVPRDKCPLSWLWEGTKKPHTTRGQSMSSTGSEDCSRVLGEQAQHKGGKPFTFGGATRLRSTTLKHASGYITLGDPEGLHKQSCHINTLTKALWPSSYPLLPNKSSSIRPPAPISLDNADVNSKPRNMRTAAAAPAAGPDAPFPAARISTAPAIEGALEDKASTKAA